jgi:hypothetical protein
LSQAPTFASLRPFFSTAAVKDLVAFPFATPFDTDIFVRHGDGLRFARDVLTESRSMSLPRRSHLRLRPPHGPELPVDQSLRAVTLIRQAPARVDWKAWLRALERKRRLLARRNDEPGDVQCLPHYLGTEDRQYLARVTRVSFEMDGIESADHELSEALAPGANRKPFRSRQAQRLRNHIAILRRIGLLMRHCQPLDPGIVVRWYTSISCGLSSAQLDEPTLSRLARVVRQINSPHLNVRPALEEIARLYVELTADPIVPSFNGILVRLLLGCHLGRCGLPPVLFDPKRDRPRPDSATYQLARLLEMVQESYDALLAGCRVNNMV